MRGKKYLVYLYDTFSLNNRFKLELNQVKESKNLQNTHLHYM